MKPMTIRERMLAVVQGKEHDLIPFAMYEVIFPPKLAIEYLGRGRIGIVRYRAIFRVEHPNCFFTKEIYKEGDTKYKRTFLHTPKGKLEEIRVFEPAYDSSTACKHFIKTRQDYEVFWSYLEDCEILDNYDQYYRDVAELGEDGLVQAEPERTPWQQLWIEWVGLESLSYHLIDFPEHVEHTIDLLTQRERKIFEIAYRSPAPYINIPDNLTAPAIGKARFLNYCVPLYDELAGMMAERGAPVFVHMDGMLKPLWKEIADSRVAGVDSFTPLPDCDMTVAEAVELWPEKLLWVNFPSSIHLASPEKIRSTVEEILAVAGHTGRLQIQASENVPLDRWQISFPIIVEAIERFGKPCG